MTVLTVNINDKKDKKALKALKAIIEAFELNYDLEDNVAQEADKDIYDAEFVAKIKKSRADYKAGKGVAITLDDILK